MSKNITAAKVNASPAAAATAALYIFDPETAELRVQKGNDKIGKEFTLCYSTIPGAGYPTFADGRPIIDVQGTCAGVCHGCQSACYAMNALRYMHNTCAESWSKSTVAIRRNPNTVFDTLQKKINRRRNPLKYVRFHVSGEFMPGQAGLEELLALVRLAYNNPDIQVYGYTKRTQLLAWFEAEYGAFPDNFVCMCSMWRNAEGVESVKNYTNAPEFHYHDAANDCEELRNMYHCPAVDPSGHETGITCEKCKRCQHARKGDKIAVYAH